MAIIHWLTGSIETAMIYFIFIYGYYSLNFKACMKGTE